MKSLPFRLAASLALLAIVAGCTATRGFEGPRRVPVVRGTEPNASQQEVITTARTYVEEGRYDDALSMFQGILGENPTITTAYLGIGEIYMLQSDYAKAEPAYARAARLEPRNFDAQYGHGVTLQMLERFLDAVRAYHRAITLRPQDPGANLNLATSYLQLKQPERALEFAERAVNLDPSNGAAQANLGAIYEKIGRFDKAVDTYIAALELMGNRPPLMINLINALAKEKRYAEAANTAENLVRLEPTANAYERLGWCYFKLRDYGPSLQAYRTAVELDPDHWPSLNGVGVCSLNAWLLSKRENMEARVDARDAFRRSLQVNPNQQKVVDLMLNYNL